MPVRVYDLAKKLGIEANDVIDKAKDLGITQAKSPSSSLDKITAAFLESELVKLFPPQAISSLPAQLGSKLSQPTPPSSPAGPSTGKESRHFHSDNRR